MKFKGLHHWGNVSAAEFETTNTKVTRLDKESLIARIKNLEKRGEDTTEEKKGLKALREHDEQQTNPRMRRSIT